MKGSLQGKVAVVTGASRGAGRGIALALGEAGATVYVTGRSVQGQTTTENLPGTIEETSEAVTARGGTGVAVRCDHTVDSNVFYDVAKNAINRMIFGIARELQPHHIAAVALAPGFMRTERVAGAFEAVGNKDYLNFTESPEYVGRAVVAIASDPNVLEKSGKVLAVGDLAEEYGFTDIDGRRIPPFRIPD